MYRVSKKGLFLCATIPDTSITIFLDTLRVDNNNLAPLL